ncbi:hypothetical protein A2960_05795 [Candidatus Gottesmanbacteria bacterium RIFCSPLOWO2_01_FULL_39_12b]|uniref:Uncharacterized protein n=1 Tax=Candidatus Gottesmanbacteria bacterium RIFCSPLOWO2_01_FULL_39_12b TaxID=1798388 RepID=A0A1F6AP34_9BACT|nr:MAG: hypothetical protein A2960_05795 [Candidatus Gottesmanbacteria bacterium RIFCSPLOWO2_01_FULL_39_12b]
MDNNQQVIVSPSQQSSPIIPKPSKSTFRFSLLLFGSILLVFGGLGGTYLGRKYYFPKQPVSDIGTTTTPISQSTSISFNNILSTIPTFSTQPSAISTQSNSNTLSYFDTSMWNTYSFRSIW